MTNALIRTLLDHPADMLRAGPLALVFDEDGVALTETVSHCLKAGFAAVAVFSPDIEPLQAHPAVIAIKTPRLQPAQVFEIINGAIAGLPKIWLHYCYNAEFLHFPFCETRSVSEMLTFHAEEKRQAMLTYAVDLYARDLAIAPNGVDLDDCCLDRSGYYAAPRVGEGGVWLERQWDVKGGLRWRFEEHVSADKRRIDRIGLFMTRPGLVLSADHTLNDAELNTISCPWHHNLTAAICSFRVAKALRANPGSRDKITTFHWSNARKFEWSSRQLMDLGLMEPGQWF